MTRFTFPAKTLTGIHFPVGSVAGFINFTSAWAIPDSPFLATWQLSGGREIPFPENGAGVGTGTMFGTSGPYNFTEDDLGTDIVATLDGTATQDSHAIQISLYSSIFINLTNVTVTPPVNPSEHGPQPLHAVLVVHISEEGVITWG